MLNVQKSRAVQFKFKMAKLVTQITVECTNSIPPIYGMWVGIMTIIIKMLVSITRRKRIVLQYINTNVNVDYLDSSTLGTSYILGKNVLDNVPILLFTIPGPYPIKII